jgi:hypothetical protein
MIDPELKNHLATIESEVIRIRKQSTSAWRALWHGVIYGAGYVMGAAIIVIIIGWVLNIVGIIPALSQQVTEFRSALQNVNGR